MATAMNGGRDLLATKTGTDLVDSDSHSTSGLYEAISGPCDVSVDGKCFQMQCDHLFVIRCSQLSHHSGGVRSATPDYLFRPPTVDKLGHFSIFWDLRLSFMIDQWKCNWRHHLVAHLQGLLSLGEGWRSAWFLS